ncbi:MAG: hypothetical protein IKL68_01070 [Clostridia bacterium]|nr:hypothetical protein [Clostridia bacterium]
MKFDLEQKIYNKKTKEYFKEVESSFYDGNYRSATVMLYSVTIADILYKLEELRDVYDDKKAKNILKSIEIQRNENRISSDWEQDLLKQVREDTEIIEDITWANLEYLKKLRNFSAHPAFNRNNELIAPTRETIAGLIEDMLNQILIRPPLFADKIIDLITEDIAEKSGIFTGDYDKFEHYIKNKYLIKMGTGMKTQTLKAFWKFVFKLENDDCNENREINYEFIKVLIKNDKLVHITEIKNDKQYYNQISGNIEIQEYLINLIYEIPEIYEFIEYTTRTALELTYKQKPYLNTISYYKYPNVEEFLKSIKGNQLTRRKYIRLLERYVKQENKEKELYDKYITIFAESETFDKADHLFTYLIDNNLENFSEEQIIRLIEVANGNNQIYNRNRAKHDNNIIIEKCAYRLGIDFDYTKYENFEYSEELLAKVLFPF